MLSIHLTGLWQMALKKIYRGVHSTPLLVITLLLIVLSSSDSLAQKRVKLKHADKLKRGSRGSERFERLLGNVVLTQSKTTIYCDSAHFFKSNNMVEAFGHVRITEGDSVTVTALKLMYDGDDQKA